MFCINCISQHPLPPLLVVGPLKKFPYRDGRGLYFLLLADDPVFDREVGVLVRHVLQEVGETSGRVVYYGTAVHRVPVLLDEGLRHELLRKVFVFLLNNSFQIIPGVYIKFEIHIFVPPPASWIHIFSIIEIHYNEGVRA